MIIKPKFGVDNLLFGMKQANVEAILGVPDKKFKDEDKNIIYLYNNLKLRFTFYEDEDFRFGYLITSNPLATILDQEIIGKNCNQVIEKLTDKGFKIWEKETFDSVENNFNETNWTIIQSEFDEVIKIEIGAVFDKKDEFDWKF